MGQKPVLIVTLTHIVFASRRQRQEMLNAFGRVSGHVQIIARQNDEITYLYPQETLSAEHRAFLRDRAEVVAFTLTSLETDDLYTIVANSVEWGGEQTLVYGKQAAIARAKELLGSPVPGRPSEVIDDVIVGNIIGTWRGLRFCVYVGTVPPPWHRLY